MIISTELEKVVLGNTKYDMQLRSQSDKWIGTSYLLLPNQWQQAHWVEFAYHTWDLAQKQNTAFTSSNYGCFIMPCLLYAHPIKV